MRLSVTVSLVLLILFGRRPSFEQAKPVWWWLIAAAALVVAQLIPLPPSIWQALPARDLLGEAAIGEAQPWRPWAIVPGGAINALMSLAVPLTVFLMVTSMRDDERPLLFNIILGLIVAAMLLGLLQFSGAGFDNPLINDLPGMVSSSFANRNHFALLLAFGCLMLPVWAFSTGHRSRGRVVIALGLSMLFFLTILATGSRVGMVLGVAALSASMVLAQKGLRRELRHAPKWAFPALMAFILVLVVGMVLVAVAADRAVSIQRIVEMDAEQDMRSRALPTVWMLVRSYFPLGAGFGSFDALFRANEPLDLLKPTYFNHAHNDFLEVALDAGLPGLLLLLLALWWWGRASIFAWRGEAGADDLRARAGSAMLLLTVVASAFDYPTRTPMIMALLVIAAVWLSQGGLRAGGPALPQSD